MRHHLVGIIALVLLGSALGMWLWGPAADSEVLMWSFGRVGILMALFWIAYRDLQRIPAWLLAAIPALLILLAIKPRWFLFLFPLVLAVAFLFPRTKTRS